MNYTDEETKQRRSILSQRHTYTSLARLYNIHLETFYCLIEPIFFRLKQDNPKRRTLRPNEVEIIVDFWGLP